MIDVWAHIFFQHVNNEKYSLPAFYVVALVVCMYFWNVKGMRKAVCPGRSPTRRSSQKVFKVSWVYPKAYINLSARNTLSCFLLVLCCQIWAIWEMGFLQQFNYVEIFWFDKKRNPSSYKFANDLGCFRLLFQKL